MVEKKILSSSSFAQLMKRGRQTSSVGTGTPTATLFEKKGAGKSGVIKVSGNGSALRQFVAKAKAEASPRPAIKLRAPDRSERIEMPALAQGPAVQFDVASIKPISASERRSFLSSAAELGEFVRAARLQQRMTQSELAEKAGIGRRFISELEAGKPTAELERVFYVCNALGVRLLAAEHDAR